MKIAMLVGLLSSFMGTSVLVLIYWYLYKSEKHEYLKHWALSWTSYLVRLAFMLGIQLNGATPILSAGHHMFTLLSAILLMSGTFGMSGIKLPKKWLYASSAIVLWIALAEILNVQFMIRYLPTSVFSGVVYIWTGILILRYPASVIRTLPALAFVIWGLHKFDYPFLHEIAWIAPYGYMLSAVLEISVAVGMLMMYFDINKKSLELAAKDWEESFDTITDMITIHDKDYNILKFNKSAMQILGLDIVNIKLKKCYEYFHGAGCPPPGCPSCEVLETGRPSSIEFYEPHLDKHLDLRAIPRLDAKGNIIGLMHVVRDITGKMKYEEALNHRLKIEELIAQVSKSFINMQSDEIDKGISYALKSLGEFTGVDRCYMIQPDRDPSTFSMTHEWHSANVQSYIDKASGLPVSAFPLFVDRLNTSDYMSINSLSEIPEAGKSELEFLMARGIKSLLAVPIKHDGKITGVIGLNSLISEKKWHDEDIGMFRIFAEIFASALQRKLAEGILRESEEKFRVVAEHSPNMIFINRGGRVVYANQKCEDVMGYKREEIISDTFDFMKLIAPEYRDLVISNFRRHMTGEDVPPYDYIIIAKDGRQIRSVINTSLITYEKHPAVLGIVTDITERQRSEDAVKSALLEKELLLKEIHHRVKNNLQIIYSLLDLQEGQAKDRFSSMVFKESKSRIKSMALVHEKLYTSENLTSVNFTEYVESLTKSLMNTYGLTSDNLKISIDVGSVSLGIDKAIPCGLIINELVTNSLKYAFPEGRQGTIGVLLKEQEGGYLLEVRDNGVGLPEGFDPKDGKTLGLQLVETLVRQIDGQMTADGGDGAKFTIRFGYG